LDIETQIAAAKIYGESHPLYVVIELKENCLWILPGELAEMEENNYKQSKISLSP
jgi:hypothetical protein